MFKVGDKIVYPLHGAGIIENIQDKEILGEVSAYYILKLPVGNMKLMVPIDKSEELGLRDIVDNNTVEEIFTILDTYEEENQANWNKRYRKNMDKIKTGDIIQVSEVVKSLSYLDNEKGLSTGEKKMLNNAKQILVSEIVLVKDLTHDLAEELVNSHLE